MADAEALLQLGDLDAGAGLDLAGQQRTPQPLGHVVDHAHALDRVAAKCFHDQVRLSTRYASFIEYRGALYGSGGRRPWTSSVASKSP